jgi:hypothetical protein
MRNRANAVSRVFQNDKVPSVKVRIMSTPRERELDGIKLDGLEPGTVREVSATIGTWLIAAGYAEAEMRQTSRVSSSISTDRRGPQES